MGLAEFCLKETSGAFYTTVMLKIHMPPRKPPLRPR